MLLKKLFRAHAVNETYKYLDEKIEETRGLEKILYIVSRATLDIRASDIMFHNNRRGLYAKDALNALTTEHMQLCNCYYLFLKEHQKEIRYINNNFDKLANLLAANKNMANEQAARILGATLGILIYKSALKYSAKIDLKALRNYISASDLSNEYKEETTKSAKRCIKYFLNKENENDPLFLAENGYRSDEYLGEIAYSLIRKKVTEKKIEKHNRRILEGVISGDYLENIFTYPVSGYDPIVLNGMKLTLDAVYDDMQIKNSPVEFEAAGIIFKG